MASFDTKGKSDNDPPKFEVAPGIRFTKPLADHWHELAVTRLSYVNIDAQPANELPISASKFGGNILLPKHISYPLDDKGARMFPLAQLNLAEIPHIKGFPDKGWLQFYISLNETYGMDMDNPYSTDGFRILYFEEIDEENVHANTLPDENMYRTSTVRAQHALKFSLREDYISPKDVGFEKYVGKDVEQFLSSFDTLSYEVFDELKRTLPQRGHKLGGYGYFMDEDPRWEHKEASNYILLLQIDSLGDHITWPGGSAGKFFIHPDDLLDKDFSNVMYAWDCT